MTTEYPEAQPPPPADGMETVLRRQLAAAENRIEALAGDRSRIVAASESSNADDEHDPEGATIAYERELLASLLGSAREDRVEVLAALERLAAGGYGSCEACGRPIGEPRLAARPTARRCIACST